MTDQNDPDVNKNETRFMLISVVVVVMIILGGMGINMLVHHDAPATNAESSGSQN